MDADFLQRFDPRMSWKQRTMTLNGQVLRAYDDSSTLPDFGFEHVKLCTIQHFSREVQNYDTVDIAVAYVTPESVVPADPAAADGKGADDPDVTALLSEFRDVLVSKLPTGLPPERFASDGTPIRL